MSASKIAWRDFACVVPLLLLSSIGCGGGVGDVNGKIAYKGKLVASGTVVLVASDKVPRYGTIQNDGTYFIKDVPTGEALLAVNSPDPRTLFVSASNKLGTQPTAPPTLASADLRAWFPLSAKAGDPIQSGLKHSVRRGPNLVDIDIED